MWDRAYHFLFGDAGRLAATVGAIVAWHLLFLVLRRRRRAGPEPVGPSLDHDADWPTEPPPEGRTTRRPAGDPMGRLIVAHREGRHEQAVAVGMALLKDPTSSPTREADIRRRVADALDGLGREEEAEEHRRLAVAALEQGPRDPAWAFHLGRLLVARRDFDGACRASEEGLGLEPNDHMRALLTRCLANDLFHAGRMEESARRAEEALELSREPEDWLSCHRQAAASFSSLGRLDDAEQFARGAVELAEEWGDSKDVSDTLAFLAEISRKQGRLEEALTKVERAEAAGRPTRETEVIRFEILRSWGRFDEALMALDRAEGLDPLVIPRLERFSRGVHAFVRAHVLVQTGRLDQAAVRLDEARALIEGDPKLGLWCDATTVELDALRGRREEAIRGFEDVERRSDRFATDPGTLSGVLASLGREALALGEYERAIRLWERYLALTAFPVNVPTGLYHLAEARRGLGDNEAARAHYREAIATGLDTHYVRLAQSRLRTLPI